MAEEEDKSNRQQYTEEEDEDDQATNNHERRPTTISDLRDSGVQRAVQLSTDADMAEKERIKLESFSVTSTIAGGAKKLPRRIHSAAPNTMVANARGGSRSRSPRRLQSAAPRVATNGGRDGGRRSRSPRRVTSPMTAAADPDYSATGRTTSSASNRGSSSPRRVLSRDTMRQRTSAAQCLSDEDRKKMQFFGPRPAPQMQSQRATTSSEEFSDELMLQKLAVRAPQPPARAESQSLSSQYEDTSQELILQKIMAQRVSGQEPSNHSSSQLDCMSMPSLSARENCPMTPGAYSDTHTPGVAPQRLPDLRFSVLDRSSPSISASDCSNRTGASFQRHNSSSVRSSQKSLDKSDTTASLSFPTLNEELMIAEELLVEAHPVLEEQDSANMDSSHGGLSIAESIDHYNETHRKLETETRHWKRNILIGVLLVIVVVVTVLLVSLLPPSDQDNNVAPTPAPSMAPTSQESFVLSLLPEYTKRAIQQNPSSPQAKALDWLFQDLNSSSGSSSNDDNPNSTMISLSDPTRILQRYALATLNFATNGDKWVDNANWLEHSVHECLWENKPEFAMGSILKELYPGLLDGFDPTYSSVCNGYGIYHNLWLDQNSLEGKIPEELYLLTSLETISLGSNRLEGSISTRIGLLTGLRGMVAFYNAMTGTVPTEVGLLSSTLEFFSFPANKLEGSLPSELWQLTHFNTLDLNNNPVRTRIPTQVGLMKNLRWLVLDEISENTGTIPTEIGLAQNLQYLVLDDSHIRSTLPSELGLLSNLWFLALQRNFLTGTLPTQLGGLSQIFHLTLHNNQLEGTLPSELGSLTALSVNLNVGENGWLNGTVPTELGKLTKLRQLGLANNRLTGKIPSQLGLLASIDTLHLNNNSFTGQIPPSLSSLRDTLHTLGFRWNPNLSGTVPESLCNLNGTCASGIFAGCGKHPALYFDCTSKLCGCSCACGSVAEEGNKTRLVIIDPHN